MLRAKASPVFLTVSLACVTALLLACTGCSSTTSTTRELEDKPTGVIQDENEFIYLAKIKKEKAKEDDKKVNVPEVKQELEAEATSSATDTNFFSLSGLRRDSFLLEVVNYLGVRYLYGGSTKKGLDCSAFTCQVYKNAASKLLPRSTFEQFKIGDRIKKDELQFGDLVFFNTTGRTPSHVGIYIEDGIFAHASVVDGVTLSSLESTYYKKRFVGARRVVE